MARISRWKLLIGSGHRTPIVGGESCVSIEC
jgi:hypothetical protein